MARTVEEIHKEIIAGVETTPELTELAANKRKNARWRLFGFIIAVSQNVIEKLFERHAYEVKEIINTMKPHSLAWYAFKAKDFQYGASLPAQTDVYDNALLTDAEIASQKIIKLVAVEELEDRLRIKAVKETNGELNKLEQQELQAFVQYMQRIKDAGVRLQIDSLDADSLKLEIDIYYDPLVINAFGCRIDGKNDTPCLEALNQYLSNLPFNGLFIPTHLVDKLQQVDGVEIPILKIAQAKYGNFDFTDIAVKYKPDAGYLKIYNPEDLLFNYIANV